MGAKGVTPAELTRTVNGSVRELPGSFETADSVLTQMRDDERFKRPANFVETLAERYKGLDAAALDAAVRESVDPNGFTWWWSATRPRCCRS